MSPTSNDSGPGSLRQTITDANAATGDDTINISATGTINLKGALPNLFTNMEIKGPGADKLTVRRDTGGDYLIFKIFSSNISISGLTVTN